MSTALDLDALVTAGINGTSISREDALAILAAPDDQVTPLPANA